MIEINLIKQKEPFRIPIILGLDLNVVNWKMLLLFLFLSNIPEWFIYPEWEAQVLSVGEEVASLEKKLASIRKDIKKNDGVVKQLESYNRQVERLRERGTQVEQIIKTKINPKKLLEKVARSIPKDVWLNEFMIDVNRVVTIHGESPTFTSIEAFRMSLNESEYFKNSLAPLGNFQVVDDQASGIRLERFSLSGRIFTFDPWGI